MRNSFIFYASYAEAFKELNGKDRLQVMDALIAFAIEGREVDLTGVPKAIFTLIRPTIEANIQRYENGKKGAEYGARGGRPRSKNPNGVSEENPYGDMNENTDGVQNETPYKEKDKDKEQVSKKERDIYNSSTNSAGARESYDEIMERWEIFDRTPLRAALGQFIRHCMANGQVLTNDRFEDLICRLFDYYGAGDEKGMCDSLYRAINGGYFDIREGRK